MPAKDINKIRIRLIEWYTKNCRDLPWRQSKEPYAIWVSEVMLQQTQVKTVIPYYDNFLKLFPTTKHLAAADLQEVLKAWEGMGYYARARNLHKAAVEVTRKYGGKLPDEWDLIRNLPGVGDYIASAVLSIAFDKAYAVVDGNVKRVLARLFKMPEVVNKSSFHKVFRLKADNLLDRKRPGTFNQAMMELGALLCTPNHPHCNRCPLSSICKAHGTDSTSDYPKRESKKSTPKYHIVIGIVRKNCRMLITRRKPDGLLGGLWEFPGGKINPEESPAQALEREIAEETSLHVKNLTHLTRVKHAYTHFKIEANVFICDYAGGRIKLNGPTDYRWINPTQLEEFPFPKANHKFFPLLRQFLKTEKR